MSDERLRELERRFHETSALEDEVALLHEQVRTGALDPLRLRLAGRLGSEAARRVDPDPPSPPEPEEPWRLPEEAQQGEPLLRAAWSACHVATLVWETALPDDELLRAALDQAARWILAPSAQLAIQARRLLAEAQEALHEGLDLADPAQPRAVACLQAVHRLTNALAQPSDADRVQELLRSISASVRATHARAVRPAIERHLVAWALGRGDPLRARVEAGGPQ